MADKNQNQDLEGIIPNRLPPQSIEAEQSVLGSLMLDKDAITKIADILSPSDFYRGTHQMVYQTMLELFDNHEAIDILSASQRLKEKKQLEEIGGNSYLTSLINSVPTASHVVYYAKAVRKKKILRDLIKSAEEISVLGYRENEDVDILLDEAEKKIFGITQKSLTQYFLPVKSTLGEAFERIEKLSKREGRLRGISTGFYELDDYLGGFQKSDLIILASRPSLGKSSLSLDFARSVAMKEKVPVGIFSLEMSKDQVIDRLIAAQSEVSLWKLRTGRLSSEGEDNDFTRIQNALGVLSETPIYIDDAPSSNILQMRAMSRRLQAEYGLGLIIVDYLQLMESRRSFGESEVQRVTEISRSLKALAREIEVPVLAISQLSRAVEQRSPQIPRLSDLRESGSLEQDSDVVLFIYREDREKKDIEMKNIADIIIAKHRNGPTGKIQLYFDENQVSFKNLERHRENVS